MPQKEPRMSAKPTLPSADPAEFAEMGKKQVEAMINLHKELIAAIEEVNGEWAASPQGGDGSRHRICRQAHAAKTIPETATICQE